MDVQPDGSMDRCQSLLGDPILLQLVEDHFDFAPAADHADVSCRRRHHLAQGVPIVLVASGDDDDVRLGVYVEPGQFRRNIAHNDLIGLG